MKAVIFDMDGVIVDSEPRHERAFFQVLEEIGYGNSHDIRFADYIGRSDRDMWVDFLKSHKPEQSLEQLLAMKRQRVINIIKREVVQTVLALPDLQRYFSVVVSCADVSQGKPAPDIFLTAAQRLGVPANECWVIEDSKPGVAAGRAAGMSVIAITNTYPAEELQGANHVVQTYHQIGDLLLHNSASSLTH
jgi:HAD superfamily hydrolase (TIGR01509 family)